MRRGYDAPLHAGTRELVSKRLRLLEYRLLTGCGSC
jgi:hypothetical protein